MGIRGCINFFNFQNFNIVTNICVNKHKQQYELKDSFNQITQQINQGLFISIEK